MNYNNSEDMDGDHYADNLQHMAEPATPNGRERAVHMTLQDYQALYLAQMLREWAGYHADTDERQSIAKGYAEYLNRQVRDNEALSVDIYAHTVLASEVLMDAIEDWFDAYREQANVDIFRSIESQAIKVWGRQHADQVNKDAGGRTVYEPAPEDIEVEG